MEQNPTNNTQQDITTPAKDNQATANQQPTTANQQSFQPQYQQQLNPQQATEQPIIINTCIYNTDNLTQAFSDAKKRYIRVLIYAFIGLAIFIINSFFSDSVAINAFAAGLFSGLIIVTFPFLKALKKSAQAKVNTDVFLYGSMCQPVTYFYNSYFTCYNPQSQARFFISYQNIVDIKEYNDIYIITLKENVTVLIQKNGFNLGNAEIFKAFIQSRVPVTTKIKFK